MLDKKIIGCITISFYLRYLQGICTGWFASDGMILIAINLQFPLFLALR